jgi:hypothetical protein
MKKTLIALITGCISIATVINPAHAQGNNNVIAFTDTKTFMKSLRMLTFMDNAVDSTATGTAELKTTNAKALKDFRARFSQSMNESWYAMSDGYLSTFKIEGSVTRVYYNKKGHWQYTLKSYNEDKLPRDIRATVKRTYYDYAITLVQEVQASDDRVVYIVHLEDKSSFKNVIVSPDGEMTIMEEFQKDPVE